MLRVDEAGENAAESKVSSDERWPRMHIILFAHAKPQAILFANDNSRVLRLTTPSQTAFLVFGRYLPELARIVCDTVDADRTDICLAQVTTENGDGYITSLWAVFLTAGKSPQAKNLPLEAGTGEESEPVAANWWWDRENKTVGILRVNANGETVALYRYSDKNGLVPSGQGTIAAFLEGKNSFREAQAESIALTNNQLDIFPLKEKQSIKWAPALLFGSRKEAQRWKTSVPYGAAVQIREFAGEGVKQ